MEKKRSIVVTIICIYFLLISITTFFTYTSASIYFEIVNIIYAGASLICAVALYKLFPWGRKASILLMAVGIFITFIYHSPLMKETRITDRLKFYEQGAMDNNTTYYLNEKEVTKDEFMAHRNIMIYFCIFSTYLKYFIFRNIC